MTLIKRCVLFCTEYIYGLYGNVHASVMCSQCIVYWGMSCDKIISWISLVFDKKIFLWHLQENVSLICAWKYLKTCRLAYLCAACLYSVASLYFVQCIKIFVLWVRFNWSIKNCCHTLQIFTFFAEPASLWDSFECIFVRVLRAVYPFLHFSITETIHRVWRYIYKYFHPNYWVVEVLDLIYCRHFQTASFAFEISPNQVEWICRGSDIIDANSSRKTSPGLD